MARRRFLRGSGFAHFTEYLLLRGLLAFVSRLDTKQVRGWGTALGRIAFDLVRLRRKVTTSNLARAYPEWVRDKVEEVARACYAEIGLTFLEMFAMAGWRMEARAARVHVVDPEQFATARDAGRGAVLLGGHLGNWELAGSAIAAFGHPTSVMVARQRNRRVDALVREARERAGMRVFYTDEGLRPVLRALRRGEFVAFLFDQDAGRTGRFVPFFGRPASSPIGPFRFARLADCPIIAGLSVRQADGTYRLEMPGPLRVARDLPPEVAEEEALARATVLLEEAVRRHPEQWFWMHRRWKTRPAAEEEGS